jgi:hypothetical protein
LRRVDAGYLVALLSRRDAIVMGSALFVDN